MPSREILSRRPLLLVFCATIALALSFSLYTQHAWEDYYITFRASKNLATGHGLVFTPGEKVHSFTSPLGVLLPAASSVLAGGNDTVALWIFRVMSAGALGGAATLLFAAMRRLAVPALAGWLTVGFLVLEGKILDFTTNGMETGFLMLFLAYLFWALASPGARQWAHLGAAWAGIMWTRPDGFIYIALFGGGYGLFNFFATPRQERGEAFRLLVRAGLLCTVLYLPWFLWAWSYYGSPVPHTIIAKGSMTPGKGVGGFLATFALLPFKVWLGQTTVEGALMPAYFQPAGWSPVFHYTARAAGALAMIAWCWPRLNAPARAASLAFHGTHAYLTYFPYYPFPWYFPATGLFAAIVWGNLIAALVAATPADASAKPRRGRWLGFAVAGWVGVIMLTLTGATAVQMEGKQRIAYTGNLQRIGQWLKAHAKPTDRVFLEPLGYIGYFSQLPTYDYPGLSSPRMVEARKHMNNWSGLLLELEPTWAVLRKPEIELINAESPTLLEDLYEKAAVFDVRDAVAASGVPDKFMLAFDANFTVYRRRAEGITEDYLIRLKTPYGDHAAPALVGKQKVRVLHAPSTMVLRVPPGAQTLTIAYGLLPSAYEDASPTDGATFEILWVDGEQRQELLTHAIDPVNNPGDRGLQRFSIALPASPTGQARLELRTGNVHTTARDWTYWGNPDFH